VRLPPPSPPLPPRSSLLSHLTRLAVVAVVAFGGGALWHQHRARSYTSLGVAPERPEVVPLVSGSNGPLVQNPAAPDGPTTLALPAAAASSLPAPAPPVPTPGAPAPAPGTPAPTVAAATAKAPTRPQRRTRLRAKFPRRVQALR
jgi:hypothetical protein